MQSKSLLRASSITSSSNKDAESNHFEEGEASITNEEVERADVKLPLHVDSTNHIEQRSSTKIESSLEGFLNHDKDGLIEKRLQPLLELN